MVEKGIIGIIAEAKAFDADWAAPAYFYLILKG